jgi:hypothetical protein
VSGSSQDWNHRDDGDEQNSCHDEFS